MFKTLVRPPVDHCDIIYHIPPITNPYGRVVTLNYLMERFEKIDYQAALAITLTWKGSSRISLWEELGWEHFRIGDGIDVLHKYIRFAIM